MVAIMLFVIAIPVLFLIDQPLIAIGVPVLCVIFWKLFTKLFEFLGIE